MEISLIDIPHTSNETPKDQLADVPGRLGRTFLYILTELYDVMKGFMSIKLVKTYVDDDCFR